MLSSTAALFGAPASAPIDESAIVEPGSHYGESKRALEQALMWADQVHGLRSACLRYFNAVGCDARGRLGEHHKPETHLIPLVIDAALGRRPGIEVFGYDYPTSDESCIRDYVHVSDLAEAHILALERLKHGSVQYNLGTGTGHSVLEVIAAIERVSGRAVPVRIVGRRPGDPSILVASSASIARDTGWTPRFGNLERLVETALAW